ncbi:MAG: Ig-like domain-containing protein [Anaerolineae bacterium]|nr:Ig-like domain-containing protein [Anaerolineae bacterium]
MAQDPEGTPESEEETSDEKASKRSFWKTVPGILSGVAAVITALGGLLTVLITNGILGTAATPTPPIAAAPSVVVTTPENGAADVDPALAEIVVVFSQPMKQDSWSFVVAGSGETPDLAGAPYFRDEQTCVLPVRLEPGKTYSVGFNDAESRNFVAESAIAAEPYVLTFSTLP